MGIELGRAKLILFSFSIFSFSVFGQVSSDQNPTGSKSEPPTSQSQLQLYTNSIFRNDGSSLAWNFSSYIRSNEEYFRPDAKSELTDLDLHLKGRVRPLNVTYNIRDTYRIGEDYNYVKPYELYTGPYGLGPSQIKVGRALNSWSEADEYWMQGLYQPRFLDDRFLMEQAGLTGLFVENKWGDSKTVVWATPVHIPEMGPDFSIEENKFVSGSPWFLPPPSTVIIRGQETDVDFNVKYPELREIVLNPGFGVNWQSEDPVVRRYLSRLSAAYKPIPQLLIGFPFFLELSENADSSSLKVEINPRVLYHRIGTWETINPTSQATIHTSVTFESPERDSTPQNWITQEVSDALVASVWAEREVGRGAVDVGYLRVWGGDVADKGEFAPEGTLFERRYMYRDAVRLGVRSGTYRWISWNWSSSSRLIYDFEQAGLTWVNELAAQPMRDLILSLRADFIGLTGDEEKIERGFINTYRANDRVQAGVRYVF